MNTSSSLGTRTFLHRICGSHFAAKLAPNFAATDKKVLRFLADLAVEIGGGKISVRRAVQMVNKFADSLKGKVPDDQVMGMPQERSSPCSLGLLVK